MGPSEKILILSGALLLASVLASKAAGRFGIPALLVFLGLGILAGSSGPGGLVFHHYDWVQSIGVLALIAILFSGGLDTDLAAVRPILGSGLLLSTIGVLIATVSVGWFATTFLHFSRVEGLLLGAIIASTDVAAVFTVLRGRGVSLKERLKPLLELESAVNDPTTVFLAVGLLDLFARGENRFMSLVPLFFEQMGLGVLLGYAFGKLGVWMLNRVRLEFEGLYPVLTIGLILLAYGVAQKAGGSGFLTVYVAGIVLGNSTVAKKKTLLLFHDGIAWLMQIVMFLAMGLIVNLSSLGHIALAGISLSLFLVFIARPLSVFACLIPADFDWREKLMISWGGLRGAVPIILATFPLTQGTPEAQTIFHLVFFVVFLSVLLQGSFIPAVARWLRVDAPLRPKIQYPLEYVPTGELKSELSEIHVPERSDIAGKSLNELGLPSGLLIVLIHRSGGRAAGIVVPRGETRIEAGDTLLVLAEPEDLDWLREICNKEVSPG